MGNIPAPVVVLLALHGFFAQNLVFDDSSQSVKVWEEKTQDDDDDDVVVVVQTLTSNSEVSAPATAAKKKEKKEQLTKAQKRRMINKTGTWNCVQ